MHLAPFLYSNRVTDARTYEDGLGFVHCGSRDILDDVKPSLIGPKNAP